MLAEIIFYIFVAITLISAGIVVLSPNLTHSVFALLFTFFGVAGLYVFLSADFLAGVQLLIYAGGVLVLLLFGVMLTNRVSHLRLSQGTLNRVLGGLVSLGILAIVSYVIFTANWHLIQKPPAEETVNSIGTALMTQWLLPFEVASLLLLAALVGAAMLARREEVGSAE